MSAIEQQFFNGLMEEAIKDIGKPVTYPDIADLDPTDAQKELKKYETLSSQVLYLICSNCVSVYQK